MTNSIVPMNGHCNLPAAFSGWNKYPQFIIYRRDWSATRGKWDKTPISPKTGYACGSTDRTAAVLAEMARSRPWLSVVRHAESCGQSAAVRSGVRAAQGVLRALDLPIK